MHAIGGGSHRASTRDARQSTIETDIAVGCDLMHCQGASHATVGLPTQRPSSPRAMLTAAVGQARFT
eukprot:2678244-Alexandrium_andersonii.AAC.1